MTPYHSDPWLTVYQGDCREVMASMEAESVHCVVTSPPYWGLRDYGIGGQLGLEATPEEYVANMVAVFREVRRVLRADGTVWLNLGDSYAGGSGKSGPRSGLADAGANSPEAMRRTLAELAEQYPERQKVAGLKPKDLVGIPWRVAFALQADGWYLRSDIIWSKPNPMPESVTDRPTKAHEYLFLLSKSPRYYYDADAVREPDAGTDHNHRNVLDGRNGSGRNLRSVWSIATQPYPGAHFATFPEALVEPCVKAGTSERGVCPECGAPWVREVELGELVRDDGSAVKLVEPIKRDASLSAWSRPGGKVETVVPNAFHERKTTGWRPSCGHTSDWEEWKHPPATGWVRKGSPPMPATVLDPFAGSGTTGRVAQRLGRRAVLIDLSGEYLTQAMRRNQDIPLGLETGT
jgi:DNA modification methylase